MMFAYIIDRDGEFDVFSYLTDVREASEILGIRTSSRRCLSRRRIQAAQDRRSRLLTSIACYGAATE